MVIATDVYSHAWRVSQMKAKLSIAVLGAMLLAAIPAWAHHSFAAEFDINQPVKLSGVLTKMEWTNPHGWISIDVKNADGKVENWAIEAGGPTALLRRGLRKTDFPAGIEVTIEGYRARSGALVANGTSVKTKDGKNFFLGGPQQGGDTADAPRPPSY
jgi:cytochrome bd-type quinol oxidase subunit 1